MNFNREAKRAKQLLTDGKLGSVYLAEIPAEDFTVKPDCLVAMQIPVKIVGQHINELIEYMRAEHEKCIGFHEKTVSACGAKKEEWLDSQNIPVNERKEVWERKLELDLRVSTGNIIRSADIIDDIKPYKSMVDGSMIESRSKHREHLRRHGCVEIGNEKVEQKPMQTPKGLREDIAREAYRHWN